MINNLDSISKKGLIPRSGANSKLIGDDKIRTGQSKIGENEKVIGK